MPKKTLLDAIDTILGSEGHLNHMAKELADAQNIVSKCHIKISREFTGINEGKFKGLKVKLTLEPDRERDEY